MEQMIERAKEIDGHQQMRQALAVTAGDYWSADQLADVIADGFLGLGDAGRKGAVMALAEFIDEIGTEAFR